MFERDFEGLCDPAQYKPTDITEGGKPMMTHHTYYVRCPHDLPHNRRPSALATCMEKYQRRVQRLRDVLNNCSLSGKKVLFMRFEESTNRIIHERHKQNYEPGRHDEIYHTKRFCDIVEKLYPKLNFHVLVISNDLDPTHEGRLVVIPGAKEIRTFYTSAEDLQVLIERHADFLTNAFQRS